MDEGGNVIDVEDFEPDGKILLIAGENAPNHLVELMKVVETDKELLSKLKAAVYVSNRRWDLVFSKDGSGLVVKMPQDNFEKAYKKIALLNKRQGIFKRKLTSLDVPISSAATIGDLLNEWLILTPLIIFQSSYQKLIYQYQLLFCYHTLHQRKLIYA